MTPKITLDSFEPWHNDLAEGVDIVWSGDIGFGRYRVCRQIIKPPSRPYADDGEYTDWVADSEGMDKDDNSFLVLLLKQWLDQIHIKN